MSTLHKEILTPEQVELLPALKRFSGDFGLVGGTAIALHIGHRESIDFDLFPRVPGAAFNPAKLRRKFARAALISEVFVEEEPEMTLMTTTGVKVTFFDFEYAIPYTVPLERWIMIPDLLTLAAMKVFALGFRSKWKDYVDLFFIIRDSYSLVEIKKRANELFARHFNENLLRQQLSFFDDVSYKESIIFKHGFEVSDEEIKKKLVEYSLQ